MQREQRTAEQIRAEIARLLHVDANELPLPYKLSMESDTFEDSSANWHIPAWPGIRLHTAEVRKAILATKARWDMA